MSRKCSGGSVRLRAEWGRESESEMTECDTEYLTAGETARLLRLSCGHLANLRARRDGPPYARIGRHGRILYRRADVEQWVAARRVEPTAYATAA